MKLQNSVILILIIIVASALRLFNLFDIPFTHDEFSALFRTYFSNFSELIQKGVITDTHPAGIQVFLYYWTKLFGYAEWVVKMPFLIAGIASVYLIYLIAKNWHNETVALITASFLATIQYTIVYSQIARPYISGLFFSLLMVHFWTKMMLHPQRRFYLNTVLFILSAALCAYNHHFSLLFAAIVGLSGLFFIQREYLLKYIFSGILIAILYIPHINIFMGQLQQGGIEGWLGKPHNDFIINYIGYIFNFSTISYTLTILLILWGILAAGKHDFNVKQFILFASWFFLPFLVGFLYSKYVNSVLQYSVLIFSFPYLLFLLFGHIKLQKPIINLVIVLIIISVNSFSVIKVRQHYSLFYSSVYKQILVDHEAAIKTHRSIGSVIDSDSNISNHYIERLNFNKNFVWYDSLPTEKELIAYLEKQSQSSYYLYFGCLSGNPPATVSIIQSYYPTIEWQNNYPGGTTYLFSKTKNNEKDIIDNQNFDLEYRPFWSGIDTSKLEDTLSFSGKTGYRIDDQSEWGPSYSRSLNEIMINRNNFIDISVKAYLPEKYDDIVLVASLDSKNQNIYWSGTLFDKFITPNNNKEGKWITIYHTIKLSDIYLNHRKIQLNIFIWNKGKHNFYIDDFTIRLRAGNPIIYGMEQKI